MALLLTIPTKQAQHFTTIGTFHPVTNSFNLPSEPPSSAPSNSFTDIHTVSTPSPAPIEQKHEIAGVVGIISSVR
jgi:hypothetical protein